MSETTTSGILRITGTIEYENDYTGERRWVRIEPFEMPAGSAWVDIVDEADERSHPGHGWAACNETRIREAEVLR